MDWGGGCFLNKRLCQMWRPDPDFLRSEWILGERDVEMIFK
jgi:hypothetical protein